MNYTFTKNERLKSQKAIEALVKNGQYFFLYPFRITWQITDFEQSAPVQVAFAVPKKKFKKAADRNLIKRRLREAYRLNKHKVHNLLTEKKINLNVLIVYIGVEIIAYKELEEKLNAYFNHLMAKL